MGCCRKLFSSKPDGTKSVICLRWVLPLRVITLASLVANGWFSISHQWELPLNIKFIGFLHVLLCWLVLMECKRSADYHRVLRKKNSEDI